MSISANFPNVKPSLLLDFANAQQLPPSVTFTRATTAAYYNGSTTAKAEENLQTYSQEFDNAVWTKFQCSVTANTTTAPDGTTTAESMIEDSATNVHRISGSASIVASSAQTISVYAKPLGSGSARYLTISLNTTTGIASITFDVSTGVVTQTLATTHTVDSSSITSVGNGWYRCVATITPTVSTGFLLSLASSSTFTNGGRGSESYAGDGASGLFIWGAQLEQRSSATAYTATTTQAITNYIPVLLTAGGGQPRFDHNPTTSESLGLLIEEQRTNLLTYSSEFDNGVFTKINTSVIANTSIAPDGTLTGDLVYPNASSSSLYGVRISRTQFGLTSTQYTNSFYVKSAGWQWIYVLEPSGNSTSWFDIQNGVLGDVSANTASITAVGNSWYKITVTRAVNTDTGYLYVNFSNSNNSFNCTNSGIKGVFLWGAQLEAGAFATSYIPTTTAAATRAADAASMTGTNFSNWFNQGEGTLYSEASAYVIGSRGIFDFTDGTNNNQMAAFAGNGSSGQRHLIVRVSGSTVATLDGGSYADGAYSKQATVLKANDFALSLAGATAVTTSSGSVPIVNQMLIGDSTTSASVLNGHIRKIAYYPIRVTNAQLAALTS